MEVLKPQTLQKKKEEDLLRAEGRNKGGEGSNGSLILMRLSTISWAYGITKECIHEMCVFTTQLARMFLQSSDSLVQRQQLRSTEPSFLAAELTE